MQLYKVCIKGTSFPNYLNKYNYAYVQSKDPTSAYNKVRKYLDDNNIGFREGRELDSVHLIADEYKYGNCGVMLFNDFEKE